MEVMIFIVTIAILMSIGLIGMALKIIDILLGDDKNDDTDISE